MSPTRYDDLTVVIEKEGNEFAVLESPETAEDEPDYRLLATFPTYARAAAFLATGRFDISSNEE
jgi:hypothetical protein